MSKFKVGDTVRLKRDVVTDYRLPRTTLKKGMEAVVTKVGPWGYTLRFIKPQDQVIYGKDLELVK